MVAEVQLQSSGCGPGTMTQLASGRGDITTNILPHIHATCQVCANHFLFDTVLGRGTNSTVFARDDSMVRMHRPSGIQKGFQT